MGLADADREPLCLCSALLCSGLSALCVLLSSLSVLCVLLSPFTFLLSALGPRYKIPSELWKQINHYASFRQTGISLRYMVRFGQNINPGSLLQGGNFLRSELPVRLAHRVSELDNLPRSASEMPSIIRVKNWYAQSFEELVNFPRPPKLSDELQSILNANTALSAAILAADAKPNPSVLYGDGAENLVGAYPDVAVTEGSSTVARTPALRPSPVDPKDVPDMSKVHWPPEVHNYNEQFTRCLEVIKRRHDAVVTTVAQGVLEYKRANRYTALQADMQRFLDRFYLSRIGIRILIGQHIALARSSESLHDSISAGNRSLLGRNAPITASGESAKPEEADKYREKYVGVICTNTNVGAMAHEAIENARFVCEEHFGLFKGPPVQLICPKDLTFMYIPSHLNVRCYDLPFSLSFAFL